jgi:hypothetical protein
MKRVLLGLAVITFVIGIVAGGAVARLIDTETSHGNTFAAGTWTGHILINEVMYDPECVDRQNEWVELYNPTPQPVDVVGWRLNDNSSSSHSILEGDIDHGDGSTIIPPHGYALVTVRDTQVYTHLSVPAEAVKLRVAYTDIGNGLSNSGDRLIMLDTGSTTVDAMEWIIDHPSVPGSPAPHVPEGHSLARYFEKDTNNSSVDFYDESSPSPGARNSR